MKKLISFVFVCFFVFASSTRAFDLYMGGSSDIKDRAYVDSYQNFSIIDTNQQSEYEGIITEIHYWARNNNPFKFLIVDETKKVV